MKNSLIAANWKSNFTFLDAENWIKFFKGKDIGDSEVVVFPPFTFLGEVGYWAKEVGVSFEVGAQNISAFGPGQFTGEISETQLKDLASYVLIGHSERRRLLHETSEEILNKLKRAYSINLKVILCISSLHELEGVEGNENLTIAYEPLESIGSGEPKKPTVANEMARQIKEKLDCPVIYGGSVNSQNVRGFIDQENINGVLVGTDSLDPQSFLDIIKNVN